MTANSKLRHEHAGFVPGPGNKGTTKMTHVRYGFGDLSWMAAAAVMLASLGLAGCGGLAMAELQRDAVIEAAGPSKEEEDRFARERRQLHELERQQREQEIAQGKRKSRRTAEAEELKRLQDEQLRRELAENQAASRRRIPPGGVAGGEGGGEGGGGGGAH